MLMPAGAASAGAGAAAMAAAAAAAAALSLTSRGFLAFHVPACSATVLYRTCSRIVGALLQL